MVSSETSDPIEDPLYSADVVSLLKSHLFGSWTGLNCAPKRHVEVLTQNVSECNLFSGIFSDEIK